MQKKLMDKEETWQAAEEGERPPSSLISGQSQKTKEVEMRRLTEENERLRCQTESLKEEMRNMAEKYESRQTELHEKMENAIQDLMIERLINNETRLQNEKLDEELKKLQALVAALAPNSQDERARESNEDDQDPERGAHKGGKNNEDLKDKEADKAAEKDDDKEVDKDSERTGKEDEAAEKMEEEEEKDANAEDKSEAAANIAQLPMQNSEELDLQALEEVERELKKNMANEDDKEKEEATEKVTSAHKKEMSEPQIPTQNSEDLYVEELEQVEEELKKKKKADDETKAYTEQPPESPPRTTIAEEARWSLKTPVTEMPSFDLGISPWVSWNSPLVTGIITIPEKNFSTPSSPQIIDLTMMEREPAKYQMIVSPQFLSLI